jgi:hypothetical protein
MSRARAIIGSLLALIAAWPPSKSDSRTFGSPSVEPAISSFARWSGDAVPSACLMIA